MKQKLVVLMVALSLLPAAPAGAADKQSLGELVQRAVDNHIVPRITQLEASAGALAGEIKTYCAAPSEPGRAKIIDRFHDTVVAWAAIDFVRMGPIAQGGRHERFAFWPDTKGVMERQLRPVLARQDKALLEPGALAKQSATLQGLPALEMLIADTTIPMGNRNDEARFRCALAERIGENLAAVAHEIVTGWTAPDGQRQELLTPGPDNLTYKSDAESASDVVKSLVTGLQQTLDQQVGAAPPDGKRKAVSPPYRRLGVSQAYLQAAINSCADLYDATGLAGYLPPDKDGIKRSIANTFANLRKAAKALPPGKSGEAKGGETAEGPDLKSIRSGLGDVRLLIANEVVPAAGLTVGFNELDGD
jgi:predicted lipoprotein